MVGKIAVVAVNGGPALALYVDAQFDGVVAVHVGEPRITGLYYVRNPQKLTYIDSQNPLTLR